MPLIMIAGVLHTSSARAQFGSPQAPLAGFPDKIDFSQLNHATVSSEEEPAADGTDQPPQVIAKPLAKPADPMLAYLRNKLVQQPQHSDSWRLLGRVYQRSHQLLDAKQQSLKAIELDPQNIAAHHDLGELLAATGEPAAALLHFQQVLILGPATEQAQQVAARGITAPGNNQHELKQHPIPSAHKPWTLPAGPHPDDSSIPVLPAGFQVKTFDGSDDLEEEIEDLESLSSEPQSRWRGYWDVGLLYNSNISLTPISRELLASEAAGFQALFSPDTEWSLLQRERLRSGPLLRGFFNLNESQNRDFNLSSFQPGLFLETDFARHGIDWIGRTEYVYSIDSFAGERTADRHAMQLSATGILPSLDVLYVYFAASQADFVDDGSNPDVTSLDGPLFTLGASRFFQTQRSYFTAYSFGADVEHAATRGQDFQYSGIGAHGSFTLQLSPKWDSIFDGGLGYRDYSQFTGEVPRNETIYRVGARLSYHWSHRWRTTLSASYERFASDNVQFDTDRLEAGLVSSWLF